MSRYVHDRTTQTTPVIAICMPNLGQIHTATMASVMALDVPKPYHFLDRREVTVEQARNEITAKVLFDPALANVTHLLWIDDDMVFAPDALRRLLAHDLDIVGGLCHGRRAPHYAPILCYRNPRGALGYTYRHEYPRSVIEVDATGGAFLLVKRAVFEKIEAAYPEDGTGPFTNGGRDTLGCGEDISFCERAKAQGFKVFVDCSLEIGHIAEVVVDSAFSARNRAGDFNPWFPPPPKELIVGEPVASIIIPTWNPKPEWLREAVASALRQTVPVEVLIVDDGSQPKALDVLLADPTSTRALFAQALDSERLRVHRLRHGGCFPAINYGIAHAKTEWISIVSHDDFIEPVKIEKQLKATIAGDALASFHGYHVLRPDGQYDRKVFVPHGWKSIAEQQAILRTACPINMLTALIHRSVFDELGYFAAENFPITADWEMWNRIGQKFFWLPVTDVLATRREHTENASTRFQADPAKLAAWQKEDAAIREKYAIRCPDCARRMS